MAAGLSLGLPAEITRSRLRDVRGWWRAVHPRAPLSQRLYVVYCVALYGLLGYGLVTSTAKVVLTPAALADWGPALGLVALLLGARWGAVQGPVVYSVADVAQLLGAPLPRRELATRRLVRALVLGAAAGAVIAACAIVGLAGQPGAIGTAAAAGLVAGIALGGVLAVLAGWAVQASARADRALRLATWPLLAAAGALAWAAQTSTLGRDVALSSGPWGWAIAPATGIGQARWLATLAVLAAVTLAAAIVAVRRCGHCPTERHFARAEARNGAIASMMSFDARTARRSLAAVGGGGAAPSRPRSADLGPLRRAFGRAASRSVRRDGARQRPAPDASRPARGPELAVVWRDAVVTLRARARLVQAVVLAGGGTLLSVVDGHPLAVIGGQLATYVAAAQLLEPLRAEIDAPSRVRALLRARIGRVLASHAVVPALVVSAASMTAAAGGAIAGVLEPDHGAVCALVAIAAAPTVTLCAGMSSRRGGRLPLKVLTFATGGDPTGAGIGVIVGWLLLWPTLAAALGAIPVLVASGAPSSALTVTLLCCVAAPAAITGALARELDEA